MNVAGLVLEVFLPGIISLLAILLVNWESKLVNIASFSDMTYSFLIIAAIVFAYVLGIVMRHFTLLRSSAYYYSLRIKQSWLPLAVELERKFACSISVSNQHGDRIAMLSIPDSETETFTERRSKELISYLRDYFLANKQPAWSEYAFYQWNFARLARNTQVPLILMCLACIVGVVNRIASTELELSVCYGFGAVLFLTLAILLAKVHKERLFWHVDILMRTAAVHLCWANNEPNIPSV